MQWYSGTLLPETQEKYDALKQYLGELGSVAVALSGGVDSVLLARVCMEVLGTQALAITLVAPFFAKQEKEDACKIAALIGIKHILLEENKIGPEVLKNPVDRCYLCKKTIFEELVREARKYNISYVADGSNVDDLSDYRPGMRALRELQIKSPLLEVGLNKNEIRELSEMFALPTSDKPAYACLASRIPYHEKITREKLERIEKAEVFLRSLGFLKVRVRNHGTIARIEVAPEERQKLLNVQLMDTIAKTLKSFGFLYVCMELEGYVMGSLNRENNKEDLLYE